ncbi:MAG TPA: sulfotransferase, partial [Pirellulales bacterium]|nr:sulfotransferase [Pirellulales bacterium]
MPEIPNHERLIVVLGMARSGTTIFTCVLCRHPQIALFRSGPEAWLLENDCLPRRQADLIGRVRKCDVCRERPPWRSVERRRRH